MTSCELCPDANSVAAYVAGTLATNRVEELDAHFAECAACGAVLGLLATTTTAGYSSSSALPLLSSLHSVPPTAERVGRFHLLDLIGAGGMGLVFSAYDPQLDRRVALKLLRPDRPSAGTDSWHRDQQFLHREARALARLNHPNVVAVHEVGLFESNVFIAMEYLAGGTVGQWLDAHPRSWRDIIEMFVTAGRGLAAAHAAGLVHRDFKPDNVLLGSDGRPRVADFGLANPVPKPAPNDATELSCPGQFVSSVTALPGIVAGTPAYMAPEQKQALPVDARADQYSFCVSLSEALSCGDTAKGRNARAPARIHAVLARGLSEDPNDRYPSVEELLHRLSRVRQRGGRTVALAVAAVGLGFAALVASALWLQHPSPAVCSSAAMSLEPVWNQARRDRMAATLARSDGPRAVAIWHAIEPNIDDYATQWQAAHTDACEDTHVRHIQSEQLLDARMACLDSKRLRLDTVLTVLESSPGLPPSAGTQALELVGALAECDEPATLLAMVAPEQPEMVARIMSELTRAEALGLAGRYREGSELAIALIGQARVLDHWPTTAAVLRIQGRLMAAAGKPRESLPLLEEAAWTAVAGRAYRLLVETSVDLVRTNARLARWDDALTWGDRADQLSGLLSFDPWLSARLDAAVGSVYLGSGDLERAARTLRRALEAAPGDSLDPTFAGRVAVNLGVTLNRSDRLSESLAVLDTAVAQLERRVGSVHPIAAAARMNRSAVLCRLGRYAECVQDTTAALAAQEQMLGADHPQVAATLVALAGQQLAIDQLAEADASLGRARTIVTARLGSKHPDLIEIETLHCRVRLRQEHLQEAIASCELAIAIAEQHHGRNHHEVAGPLQVYAVALGQADRSAEALRAAVRAAEVTQQHFGDDSARLDIANSIVGGALRGLRRHRDAARLLQSVLARYEARQNADELVSAGMRFDLAISLWETGDREHAHSQATAALASFTGMGPLGSRRRQAAEHWLETHGI